MRLGQISDNQILSEYRKRFRIPVGNVIENATDAVEHLRLFFEDKHRESFVVIFLNGRNALLATEILFTGSLTTSAVYPRELVRRILHHGSAAIICSHNHPSGGLNPSRDDLEITKKIKAATIVIDVQLHDHLVLTDTDFYSFADHGIL